MLCLDSTSGRLIWQKDFFGNWPIATDVLGDYVASPMEGGIEIIDVATGAARTVRARDLGLTLAPEAQLPQRLVLDPVPQMLDQKYDWWQDRLFLWIPALPLVIWGAFRLYRWRRRPNRTTS